MSEKQEQKVAETQEQDQVQDDGQDKVDQKLNEQTEKSEQVEEYKVNRSNLEHSNEDKKLDQNDEQKSEEDQKNDQEQLDELKQSDDEKENNQNEDEDDQDSQEEIPESEKSLEKALEFKEKANKYFYDQAFDDAIEFYYKALKYCPLSETKQCSVLNSNLAICYLKKNDYETVIQYSSESIKLDPKFKKPYLNRITAYEKTEKLEEAIEDLKELEKLDPDDKQIKTKIFIMQKDLEKLNEKRKTEVLSGLKDLGNTILGKFGLSLDNFKLNQNDNGSYNIQFSK
ncbi:tetratricopeptide repeat protein (macronuclear) [Tetrahymena thermophila SB210]|uniref:Tetratricopeptide repeat protein n=1 Tax=Tetrahymena thermophila (strain SB210) TaxID=312017 RepID=I7M3N6_TETTS|nr:tetratricopeptide repeat protein [Tetrahymena thermophila SB210]EAS03802.1 tetratricopeptide repeat protein [Tetrahymena thermophila SB210]|eukprot:XP_001024047.1 tetratricopeptide repeat protein [Tetrahymena thermophila SB210]